MKIRKSQLGNKMLGAWVPLEVYVLAHKQAKIEGQNMSQLLGKLLIAHLRKSDTVIEL